MFANLRQKLCHIGIELYSPKYLAWTNVGSAIAFFGVGDVLVQKVVEHRRLTAGEIDLKHFGVSCVAGGYMGAVGHIWYSFLDRQFPGRSMQAIRRKLAAEIAVGPPFAGSIFLVVGALSGKSIMQIWSEIRSNILYLLAADWGFYIPMQYFNFLFLPPRFRVLYVACISIVYDSVLVYLLHKNSIEKNQSQACTTNTAIDDSSNEVCKFK